MPMLGDMLAAARQSSGAFQAWLAQTQPELASRVEHVASAHGLSPAGYVRVAMADFSRFAAEEDWATLTSNIKDTDDPGTVCLLGMVHWRLTVGACEAHSSASLHIGNLCDDRQED